MSVYVHTRMMSADFMCLLGSRDKCDKTCYQLVTRFLTLSEIMIKSNEERKKKRTTRRCRYIIKEAEAEDTEE